MSLLDALKFEPCDELTASLVSHMRTCEHCREELQELLKIPAIGMLAKRLPKNQRVILEGMKNDAH
jgi:hypothetical protein